jgi:hypothetical protein
MHSTLSGGPGGKRTGPDVSTPLAGYGHTQRRGRLETAPVVSFHDWPGFGWHSSHSLHGGEFAQYDSRTSTIHGT